jgi:hypothetical protein
VRVGLWLPLGAGRSPSRRPRLPRFVGYMLWVERFVYESWAFKEVAGADRIPIWFAIPCVRRGDFFVLFWTSHVAE